MSASNRFGTSVSKRVAINCLFIACFAILTESMSSMSSTRPSSYEVRHWEAIHGPILPNGYSDFRGHWQSHDVGVQIFSFSVPTDRNCDAVFDDLSQRLPAFRMHERSSNKMALRRNIGESATDGFDEYRFVCMRESNRVFAMFANLDSEMEMHPDLVRKLHEIASGNAE